MASKEKIRKQAEFIKKAIIEHSLVHKEPVVIKYNIIIFKQPFIIKEIKMSNNLRIAVNKMLENEK